MTLPIAIGDLIALLAAIPLAALGGEAFLKGVLGVAAWLRLPNCWSPRHWRPMTLS